MIGLSLPKMSCWRTASPNISKMMLRRLATSFPSKQPLPSKWVEAAKKEIDKPDTDSLLWHTAEGIVVKV
jgi:hypothetical protein